MKTQCGYAARLLIGCLLVFSSKAKAQDLPLAPSEPGPSLQSGQLIYQIYPRAFYDGSDQPDGIGDLKGLQLKLDYLQAFGADTLLLMPLHSSQDPLGYIPRDLFSISADYGSIADLKDLAAAAHQRGIKILIDSPLNHMADDSLWVKQAIRKSCDPWDPGYRADDPNLRYCKYFYQVGNPWSENPYRNWHKPWDWDRTTVSDVWHRVYGYNPSYHRDAYMYASFSPNMPDLKFYDPSSQRWNEELLADMDRYIKTWIDIGIDGLRIDAAKHLVEGNGKNNLAAEPLNLQLLARFKQTLQTLKPNAPLLGEIWDSYPVMAEYLDKGAIDAFFDFGFMGSLRESLKNGYAANFSGNLQYLESQGARVHINQHVVTLGNHDVNRIMTELSGDQLRVVQAFFIMLSSPFPALVYYGDEVGMEGLVKRPTAADPREYLESTLAFPWRGESPMVGFPGTRSPQAGTPRNAATFNLNSQLADQYSLYFKLQNLIKLRKSLQSDGQGQITVLKTDHTRVFGYAWPKRGGGCYAAFVNFDGTNSQTLAWPVRPLACGTEPAIIHWNEGATVNESALRLDAKGQSLVEWPAAL